MTMIFEMTEVVVDAMRDLVRRYKLGLKEHCESNPSWRTDNPTKYAQYAHRINRLDFYKDLIEERFCDDTEVHHTYEQFIDWYEEQVNDRNQEICRLTDALKQNSVEADILNTVFSTVFGTICDPDNN